MTGQYYSVKQYIESINNDDILWQMIADREQLERDGYIDNCTLRTNAEYISGQLGIAGYNIVMMMDRVAFECYRYFAHKYKNQ